MICLFSINNIQSGNNFEKLGFSTINSVFIFKGKAQSFDINVYNLIKTRKELNLILKVEDYR